MKVPGDVWSRSETDLKAVSVANLKIVAHSGLERATPVAYKIVYDLWVGARLSFKTISQGIKMFFKAARFYTNDDEVGVLKKYLKWSSRIFLSGLTILSYKNQGSHQVPVGRDHSKDYTSTTHVQNPEDKLLGSFVFHKGPKAEFFSVSSLSIVSTRVKKSIKDQICC